MKKDQDQQKRKLANQDQSQSQEPDIQDEGGLEARNGQQVKEDDQEVIESQEAEVEDTIIPGQN